MRAPSLFSWIAVAVLASACDSKPAPDAAPTATAGDARSAAPGAKSAAPSFGATTPEALRSFGADATFGELVKRARAIDDAHAGAAKAACLLRVTANGVAVEGKIDPVVRPLPDAPIDVDAILERSTAPARVRTRWGAVGAAIPSIDLAAITAAPRISRNRLVPVFIATNHGVYLRIAVDGGPKLPAADTRPMTADEESRVKTEMAPNAPVAVITAEADVPLAKVRDIARWFEATKTTVVLAVMVDDKTPLPAIKSALKPGTVDPDACPAGITDVPKGATVGQLPEDATLFDNFRNKIVTACAGAMAPASGGGTIHVAMRVEPDGSISKSCAESDDTEDAALRTCVLKAVRGYSLAAPSPKGIVNLGIDVTFPLPGAESPICK